ncbi:hypothetical protein EG68_06634 [Paragonimus skrjabini miyazakii]|uniref:Secreted protein n=1 Tax=Paragonimus skrjabini miyazakii TaxID=59628 RepID=A0A8S9YSY0_9TREM|nr:hypothetical protein EG68_06634 [Paragonimus skrjabini miyazakii]
MIMNWFVFCCITSCLLALHSAVVSHLKLLRPFLIKIKEPYCFRFQTADVSLHVVMNGCQPLCELSVGFCRCWLLCSSVSDFPLASSLHNMLRSRPVSPYFIRCQFLDRLTDKLVGFMCSL